MTVHLSLLAGNWPRLRYKTPASSLSNSRTPVPERPETAGSMRRRQKLNTSRFLTRTIAGCPDLENAGIALARGADFYFADADHHERGLGY